MISVSRSGRAGRLGAAVLVVAGLLCRGAIARGDAWAILPASGENISSPIIDWSRDQLVSRLATHGRDRVGIIDAKGVPTREPPTAAEAVAAARALGAGRAVTFHLAHHRDETWLTVTSYAADGAAPPFRMTERLTAGPTLLLPVIDRMAYGLIFPVTWQPSAPSASASAGGMMPVVRRAPRETFVGVGAGFQVAFNSAGREDLWLPSATLFVMKLNRAWMADARFEYASASLSHVASLGAGLYAPLAFDGAGGPWGFYLGGGAKWTVLQMGGRGANGLAVQPTVGWFYRAGGGPVLRAEAAYVANLFREQELDRLIAGSGGAHISHGPAFTLGMAF